MRKCTSGWDRETLSALKGQRIPFSFFLFSVVVWFYAYQGPEHSRTRAPTSSDILYAFVLKTIRSQYPLLKAKLYFHAKEPLQDVSEL